MPQGFCSDRQEDSVQTFNGYDVAWAEVLDAIVAAVAGWQSEDAGLDELHPLDVHQRSQWPSARSFCTVCEEGGDLLLDVGEQPWSALGAAQRRRTAEQLSHGPRPELFRRGYLLPG
jgi:hypothetical protein